MRPRGPAAGLVLLALGAGACDGGAADTADDSGGDAPATDACAVAGPTPSWTDEADCAGGVCEVPAGPGWIGAATPDHPDRCPPREVQLSAFAVDRTEVTQAAWATCAAAGACAPQPAWCVREGEDADQLPVTCVDHAGAAAYCAWAGGRLPTEAEWELAARGRGGAPWAWGEAAPSCNHANYRFVSAYCWGDVAPVGESAFLGDSAFGLVDTAGNAWEWVADWYDAEVGRDGGTTDPRGPVEGCRAAVGAAPGACTERVLRGGAWNTTEGTLDPASRSHAPPDLVDVNVGFRCAWDR